MAPGKRSSDQAGAAAVTPATVSERAAAGKAVRAQVPRSAQAHFRPAPDRADPVMVLERQAASRVPELVPIRYGRMLASPFAFFRGAAAVMALDLLGGPTTGLGVQCCGDAHLSNFGVFASPERRLVFDLNDFDETARGPWEWDVKRLAASLVVAAREAGFAAGLEQELAATAAAEYRGAMASFATMTNLEVWYSRLEVDELFEELRGELTAKTARQTTRALAKARTHDSISAFSKLVRVSDGTPRIVADPPLIVPIDELSGGIERGETLAMVRGLYQSYASTLAPEVRTLLDQYRLVDVARKVVGVGSVGTRCWIVLLLGRDARDPLFLQIKEAQTSVLQPAGRRGGARNQGERVVTGQRVMQASSDILLGWLRVDAEPDGGRRDFYARQLRDWKGSADIQELSSKGLLAYGRLCGWTLARAHARSGDRIAIDAYLGRGDAFDRAIAGFARAYADQNERDYEALQRAVREGRVRAQEGV